MLIFHFSVLKGPNCTKNSRSRTSHFGAMGIKSLTFPPSPQKLRTQITSIFCTGYPRNDPHNPENCTFERGHVLHSADWGVKTSSRGGGGLSPDECPGVSDQEQNVPILHLHVRAKSERPDLDV